MLESERVIFSQDDDFLRIHHAGNLHPGIVYSKQGTRSVGEIIRFLQLMNDCLQPEDMRCRLWDDDEPWAEDDSDPHEAIAVPCPECGSPVEAIADKCSACGYWLSDSDRLRMWPSELKPLWLRVTTVVVLTAFLVSLLAIGVTLF
jgi:hypothetical protein